MIAIEKGKGDGSAYDKIYSSIVSQIQDTFVRIMVKYRSHKYLHLKIPVEEKFNNKLNQLGLVTNRLWWGPMTLFPRKAQFLIKQIEDLPPKNMLEVGGGTSTAIFSALGKKYHYPLITLENHQGTIDYILGILNELDCHDQVVIQKCGFVKKHYNTGQKYRWYDADFSRLISPIDFVFIDGPMGTLVGRNGALPEIIPYLSTDHRIFLDDSQRAHERNCIREWKQHFPELEVKEFSDCPGIVCITIPMIEKYR